jgi:MFS family permease
VSGVFVDRYGGRALLVTSLVASAACYAITASATSMSMLYLSRCVL